MAPPRPGTTAARHRRHVGVRWISIVVVVASHLTMALIMGMIRCASVMYHSWKNEFNSTASQTAAVSGIMSASIDFTSIVGGVLTDRYGCRLSGMIGGVLAFLGFLLSSLVRSILQMYVTSAIVGTGFGILLTSTTAVVALHFKKHYKTANSISFAGAGIGAMCFPQILQLLLESYGWRGTMLVSSALVANCVALAALYRPCAAVRATAYHPRGVRKEGTAGVASSRDVLTGAYSETSFNIDHNDEHTTSEHVVAGITTAAISNADAPTRRLDIEKKQPGRFERFLVRFNFDLFVKSHRFTLLCLVFVIFKIPYMGFVLFIIPRAESMGQTPSSAALLLSLYGAGDLLGRLINGILASWKLSDVNLTAIAMLVVSAALAATNTDVYLVMAVASFFQGLACGIILTIVNVIIRRLVGLKRFSIAIGFNHFAKGIGVLSGPIVTGWMYDVTGSYDTAFYVLSGASLVCVFLLLLLPLLERTEPGIIPD